jgi:hypothetical protein
MHLIIDTGMLLDTDPLNIAVHNIYNALKPAHVFILDNRLALESEVKKLLLKVGFNLSNRQIDNHMVMLKKLNEY